MAILLAMVIMVSGCVAVTPHSSTKEVKTWEQMSIEERRIEAQSIRPDIPVYEDGLKADSYRGYCILRDVGENRVDFVEREKERVKRERAEQEKINEQNARIAIEKERVEREKEEKELAELRKELTSKSSKWLNDRLDALSKDLLPRSDLTTQEKFERDLIIDELYQRNRKEEERKEAEYRRRQAEIRKSKIAKFPPEIQAAINKQHVLLGMTQEQVRLSWGEPRQINRTVFRWGVHEQWVYGDFGPYLYFEDGILTAFQDSQ